MWIKSIETYITITTLISKAYRAGLFYRHLTRLIVCYNADRALYNTEWVDCLVLLGSYLTQREKDVEYIKKKKWRPLTSSSSSFFPNRLSYNGSWLENGQSDKWSGEEEASLSRKIAARSTCSFILARRPWCRKLFRRIIFSICVDIFVPLRKERKKRKRFTLAALQESISN